MGITITITWENVESTISALTGFEDKMMSNLQRQIALLAKDTLAMFKEIIPIRTGRLRAGAGAETGDLFFAIINDVWYYKLLDEGHRTVYKRHKRRHYGRPVAGRRISPRVVKFVEANAEEYVNKTSEDLPAEL